MTPEQSIAEIRTALIGIDGKNGLRGELHNLNEKFDKLSEELHNFKHEINITWQEYLLKKRKETCYGKEELDKYIKEQQTNNNTMVALTTAQMDYEKAIKI